MGAEGIAKEPKTLSAEEVAEQEEKEFQEIKEMLGEDFSGETLRGKFRNLPIEEQKKILERYQELVEKNEGGDGYN